MMFYGLLVAVVTILVGFQYTASLPHLIRGRPKGGLLKDPFVSGLKDLEIPAEQWFNQQLTHFDDSDTRTWKQRYFYNSSHFNASGPVFLMIGGEGTANPVWLTVGSMMKYAKRFGALCFFLEHRFYGKSHPLSDLSDTSLVYLNSEQALADLAHFQTAMSKKFSLTSTNKWISFGGSYPGALSAWYRLKYPHLVYGAIATSAPIFAELDFAAYLDVVAASLSTTTPTCTENIHIATKAIAEMVKSKQGVAELSSLFKLCQPLDVNAHNDLALFSSQIAGNFMDVVQYNKDNRKFEGAVGTNITIDVLCNIMTNENTGTEIKRLAEVNALLLSVHGSSCLDASYDDFISTMKEISWESSAGEGGRQWMYQTCTEFGYFQTSDSKKQPFGSLFPVSFDVKQCEDVFGNSFNLSNIQHGIDQTNTNYGGYGIRSTKIVFPNGSIDPWHALSITTDDTQSHSVIAVFIEGTAHCANMYPDAGTDLPQLTKARLLVAETISEWLEEAKN